MIEAVKAIIQQAQKEGLNYLTATHDIKNIHSGHVMKKQVCIIVILIRNNGYLKIFQLFLECIK